MVAAFGNDPRDPQLPFQAWAQQPKQSASSPSFDYAEPQEQPSSVPIHPRIRPNLSRGAMVPHSAAQPQRSYRLTSTQSSTLLHSSVSALPQHRATQGVVAQGVASQDFAARSMAIQPVRSRKAVVHKPKASPKASYAPWVRWLMVGQKGICCLTLTLVGCALTLYGQSVYQHRQWGQSYAQLERLQKLEQQGMAASEIMKQSLAEEAERPASRMTSQLPNHSVSIETAPARSLNDAVLPTDSVLELDLDGPMGY